MVPSPEPEGAPPVIIIFGAAVRPNGRPSGTLRRRVEAAAAFGATLSGAIYMPTGAVGRFGASEASVMADILMRLGVPKSRIRLEETGTDTLSSARACARMLRPAGGGRYPGRVYAATSAYHQARCLALLRLAGVPARAAPPPRAPASARFLPRWSWRLRETAALPYDLAVAVALRLGGRL